MLEQELPTSTEDLEINEIILRHHLLCQEEACIDPDVDLYVFTWAPNPAEFPESSFQFQHQYFADIVIRFLLTMYSGCACVEASSLGMPHYHGWYQEASNSHLVELRLALIKTMKRFSPCGFKIDKVKCNYKIGSYNNKANALYYYKKECLDQMLHFSPNPLTMDTPFPEQDVDDIRLFFVRDNSRQTTAEIQQSVSLKDHYMKFYMKK